MFVCELIDRLPFLVVWDMGLVESERNPSIMMKVCACERTDPELREFTSPTTSSRFAFTLLKFLFQMKYYDIMNVFPMIL